MRMRHTLITRSPLSSDDASKPIEAARLGILRGLLALSLLVASTATADATAMHAMTAFNGHHMPVSVAIHHAENTIGASRAASPVDGSATFNTLHSHWPPVASPLAPLSHSRFGLHIQQFAPPSPVRSTVDSSSTVTSTSMTIDGRQGGRIFDGIGAVSAGASSRLLIDYPAPYRGQILDYLFKPGYGASLQHLKVEIGADTNSTAGAEPTHMRSPTDQNYTRGYEWWLMEQAKARNPAIVLSALEWGAPGWIGGGHFYSQDNINYIINFLEGAKTYHNLTIDYVGIWNETSYDSTWIKQLKSAIMAAGLTTKVVAADEVMGWAIADNMNADPALNAAVDIVGVHYPGYPVWVGYPITGTYNSTDAAKLLGKPLWATEDGPWRGDWIGAMELAKMYNRNYIEGKMTATLIWAMITSYYDVSWPGGAGLMYANAPWSGAYTVQPAIWATAHTTQFTQPGWQYIDSASGYFSGQGSYVTFKSPNGSDYSVIVETADATATQTLSFTVTGGLSQGAVHVWQTTQDSAFAHVADLSPVNGSVTTTLAPHAIYSFTTTTGQEKGSAGGAAPAAFPFPYSENFEGYSLGSHPEYLSDHEGSFEIANCTGRGGACLRQVVEQPSIPVTGGAGATAADNHNNPMTIVGDVNWKDYTVSTDVLLEQPGPAYLFAHYFGSGCYLRIDSGGDWMLNTGATTLTGVGSFPLNTWHTLALTFIGSYVEASVDGTIVASVDDSTYTHGMIGLGTGWINGQWNTAQFDNLSVQAITQLTPAPTSTSASSPPPTATSSPLPTATTGFNPTSTPTPSPPPTAPSSPTSTVMSAKATMPSASLESPTTPVFPIPPAQTGTPSTTPTGTLSPTATATVIPTNALLPSSVPTGENRFITTVTSTRTAIPIRRQELAMRLWMDVAPQTLRPGDTFVTHVRYAPWAVVHAALAYARHRQVKAIGRTIGTGLAIIRIRVPLIPLRHGHGAATLFISASSDHTHASMVRSLALSNLILAASVTQRRGCTPIVRIHLAYVANGQIQLTAILRGHRWHTVTLHADRQGSVSERRLTWPLSIQKGQQLTLRVIASGQRGRLHQVERTSMTITAPVRCSVSR